MGATAGNLRTNPFANMGTRQLQQRVRGLHTAVYGGGGIPPSIQYIDAYSDASQALQSRSLVSRGVSRVADGLLTGSSAIARGVGGALYATADAGYRAVESAIYAYTDMPDPGRTLFTLFGLPLLGLAHFAGGLALMGGSSAPDELAMIVSGAFLAASAIADGLIIAEIAEYRPFTGGLDALLGRNS
jgi:hypothetical protein